MPRKLRIHYEGALYHVMVRGNNGEKVFEADKEKEEYNNIIKEYKNRYRFKIYAYCIMDNHAHLLIEVENVPLSKIMQGIQQAYTQRYNKRYNRTGHIFQQRFKSILCQKDTYLIALIKYIHDNPVNAKITETPDYKWSSHNDYIKYESSFVNIEPILAMFGAKKKEAVEAYKKNMEVKAKMNEEDYRISDEEIEEIIDGIGKEEIKWVTIEQVISETIKYFQIERKELESGKRTKKVADARKTIVLLSKELTNESNKSISEVLRISESGVSKIFSRENTLKEIQEAKTNISSSIRQA